MNRPIRRVAFVTMVMFALLLANITFNSLLRSDALSANPQNRRARDAEFARHRGSILAVGKTQIATSKPTDDWGIRPDQGLEVPVTADVSARLRQWAEEHALRPAESAEALPFDDPLKDPYRAAALTYFRKKLGRPKP